MANILDFNKKVISIPTDLLTLKEIGKKYHLTYQYLYKITKRENELPYYNAGGIKVSEKVFTEWLNDKFVKRKEA